MFIKFLSYLIQHETNKPADKRHKYVCYLSQHFLQLMWMELTAARLGCQDRLLYRLLYTYV